MNWKALSIFLLIVVILETAFIVWAWNIGTQAIENKSECSINICADYDAFYYDDYDNICYCYTGDEITYQEYLG